ncbi:MAG: WD40 repeat domain-containing protein [Chloroflexi bacterium]|nr:WD40 repeat domain-containing protein [Chloroflexota bacterium]
MKRKHFLILLSILFLISIISFAFYLRAQDLARYRAEIRERGAWGKAQAQARVDLSKMLAATALEVKQNDVALLLAVEAFNVEDTYESRQALLSLTQKNNAAQIGNLLAHDDWVFNLALSPDGTTLATAGKDNFVYLWDIKTQKQIAKLKHTDWVNGVAFSADGKLLAAGTHDAVLTIWDTAAQKKIFEINEAHDSVIFNLAFAPEGKTLVSVIGDPLTDHTDWVLSVAYSPNGKLFVTGGDKTVRLWDAKTLTSIPLKGHSLFIHGVAVSPDSSLIASASRDKTARVWDAASGKQIFQLDHPDWAMAVAFSPDGKMLATTSRDRLVRLWDVKNGKLIGELKGHTDWVDGVAFSVDGDTLISGARDKTVRLWNGSPRVWKESACKIAKRELTNEEWKQYLGDEAHHSICKG